MSDLSARLRDPVPSSPRLAAAAGRDPKRLLLELKGGRAPHADRAHAGRQLELHRIAAALSVRDDPEGYERVIEMVAAIWLGPKASRRAGLGIAAHYSFVT